MTRLNLVLLVAVLASALYLVRTQYESRRLFTELDKARAEARKLEIDNERLQVEKRAQATPLRVERLAKGQLQMRSTRFPATRLFISTIRVSTTPNYSGVLVASWKQLRGARGRNLQIRCRGNHSRTAADCGSVLSALTCADTAWEIFLATGFASSTRNNLNHLSGTRARPAMM